MIVQVAPTVTDTTKPSEPVTTPQPIHITETPPPITRGNFLL